MRPKLFIACSIEAKGAAKQIKEALDHWYESEIWTDGFFKPGGSTAATIERRISDFDGAIFILTPDDYLITRKKRMPTPRANVLFELGMFGGALGLSNCIQVVLKVKPPLWSDINISDPIGAEFRPEDQVSAITDLAGITHIELDAQNGAETASVNDGDNAAREEKSRKNADGQRTPKEKRLNFFLVPGSVDKILKHFGRIHATDERLLGSTFGCPPNNMLCCWYEGKNKHTAEADVCVFGDRFRAKYHWPGDRKQYELSARLEGDQILWGHWWNPIEVSYGGYAQFQVRARPSYLLGAWLGWSSNGGVKSGRFIFAQRDVMKDAVRDANAVDLSTSIRDILRRIRIP